MVPSTWKFVEALEREAADEEFGRLFGLGFTVWWVDIYLLDFGSFDGFDGFVSCVLLFST